MTCGGQGEPTKVATNTPLLLKENPVSDTIRMQRANGRQPETVQNQMPLPVRSTVLGLYGAKVSLLH